MGSFCRLPETITRPQAWERVNMRIADSFRVVKLSEQDFASLSGQWDHLLERSQADPLFMSWSWLYTWWECWGAALELELVLLAAYDQAGVLLGLGPFFRHCHRTPVGISVSRLHLIGNAWRIQSTVRTEYCGLIVDQKQATEVRMALFEALLKEAWDELVLCDLGHSENEHWRKLVLPGKGLIRVPRTRDSGIRIDTRPSFPQWLKGLGKNTRLKLYNRRNYLEKKGQLFHGRLDSKAMGQFLQRLNSFHERRWGKPCFDDLAIQFHRGLVNRLHGHAGDIVLSEICFDGQCVAVQYDIRAGATMYNIQAGFMESFDNKVALGTLHLGYLIEDSFTDPGVENYDLLAGYGKNTFYKSHLNGLPVNFYTLQIARRPLLRFMYQCQALLPQSWRKGLNRIFRL
ncbi:MAG: GNAT family N-acetyltransferase [Halomonadaceae bacterium]|nr:MAG: GNAT family N-acetyltransferase [Halomonadaceae bacterium]